jgi:hypothetical protein
MRVLQVGDDLLPIALSSKRGRLSYRLETTVPAEGIPVELHLEMRTDSRPWRVRVFAKGVPECLRHRFGDDALCMWWEWHPNSRRWMFSDGLAALVHYTRAHLFQEACCRAGLPWPGEEAPGEHPRKRTCHTCRGKGP